MFKLFNKKAREVVRKAEDGEWIKVLNDLSFIGIKKGEIRQVRMATDKGVDAGGFIYHSEYVVLENYKPKKRKGKQWR